MLVSQLLIYSTTFTVLATAATTWFAWKIWRLKVTPDFTWSLKFLACSIQLIQIAFSIFAVNDIATFLSSYPPQALIISYSLSALRTGLLFAFVYNIYRTLQLKFPPQ